MKIAVWHNLPSGGGNRSLRQHIVSLKARGHTIEVFSPPTADNAYLDLPTDVRLQVVPYEPAVRIRERYFDLPKILKFQPFSDIQKMMAHSQQAAELIDAANFDVVLLHSCQKFYVPLLGQYLKTPAVLFLHEPNRLLYEAFPKALAWIAPPTPLSIKQLWSDFIENRKIRIQAREEHKNLHFYREVIANSLFSVESIKRAYGKNALWAGVGINREIFHFQGLERQNFALGLGTFYPHKGIETAIKAVAKTSFKKLVWIGNSGDPVYFEKLAQLAQSEGVEFETHRLLTDQQVVALLNTAKVMIYTSNLEPLGLAPLEAQSCGTPVVAVAEGGNRETVIDQQTGFLVERKANALAQKLQLLVSDEALWQKFSANAQEHIDTKWSLDRAIDRLELILNNSQ